MKKKAFIEYIMLGGILFLALVVFVATQADEMLARNKLYQLKKIAKDAGRTATTYFLSKAEDDLEAAGEDVTTTNKINISESLANSIIRQMTLGEEIVGDGASTTSINSTVTEDASSREYQTVITNTNTGYTLTYTWTDDLLVDGTAGKDGLPDKVKIETSDYNHKTFWYKFLSKDSFVLHAKAYYSINNEKEGSGPAVPIGINGCGKDFSDTTGTQTFDYIYQTIKDTNSNAYTLDAVSNYGFYAIYDQNGNTPSQNEIAAVKNYIGGSAEFDYQEGVLEVANVDQDAVSNDIGQFSNVFPDPLEDDNDELYMKVVVLPCGTTADTPIDTTNTLDIKIESVLCTSDSYSEVTYISDLEDYLDDDATDADGNSIWEPVGNNGCQGNANNTQIFKLRFSIVPTSSEYLPDEEP